MNATNTGAQRITDSNDILMKVTPVFVEKGVQVTSGDVTTSFIRNLDTAKKLNSFTGIQSFKVLDNLIFVLNALSLVSRKPKLSYREQVILTFMKLKLNTSFTTISILFNITIPTCKKIFTQTLITLSAGLDYAIPWSALKTMLTPITSAYSQMF